MKQAVLIFTFWISLNCLSGQSTSIFQLMQQDSTLDLYITSNWKEMERKKLEKAYHPSHIRFQSVTGDTISLDFKMRTRGNMRLKICSSPPLKLKFDKSDLAKRSLKPHNEIELVQHCHKGDQFDQYVLREYLAYRLYQEISPFSFNVQLVRIHYINPDSSQAHEPAIGLLIENTEELVDNLNARRNKTVVISQHAIDRNSLLRVCIFQYMIGNTDWFIKTRHNLEFIGIPGIPFLVTVPYDFDYSGLVNAPYAAHHESIELTSVTTRYYQGKCEAKEEVIHILNEFRDKKETFFRIAMEIPGMDQRSLKYVVDYLREFFTIIENPKKVENLILSHCDMWPREN